MSSHATRQAGVRFVVTTVLLVGARALDAITTWIATPDLALEANPLHRVVHLGWWGLLVVNAGVVVLLVAAIWRAAFRPPRLPQEPGLALESFIARYWFSTTGRRSTLQAAFWLPADPRVRWAFIGGPGAALVIVGSIIVAGWNLLVANDVVNAPAAARLGLAAFWSGLVIGLFLSVRVFLLRAYTRYAHTARVTPGPTARPA